MVSGDNWTTGAISRAKLQSNHHHQQTNIQFFLQAGCPSCRPTNSATAVNGKISHDLSISGLPVALDGFRSHLCSAELDTCLVPRAKTRLRDHSFTVIGPWLWNSLPTTLRRSDTELGEFNRPLKTDLFRVAETAAN